MTRTAPGSSGPTATTRKRPGRPPDPERASRILGAALEVLADTGYDKLTIDEVAARAQAGKATVYRHWGSKAELVVDAVKAAKGTVAVVPDTGSLRGDLEAVAESAETGGRDRDLSAVLAALVTAASRDPELAEVFRSQVTEPRKAAMREILERARRRGEIPPGRDIDLLLDIVPAMMCARPLTEGRSPDPGFGRRVLLEVLLPLATAPAGRRSG